MSVLRKTLLAAAALFGAAFAAGAAQAEPGYTTTDVNLRAGPSIHYPVVITLPFDADLEIFGCLDAFDWCDVEWGRYRGWVAADYLGFYYADQRYDLPTYRARYRVPVIEFNFGYWDAHYRSYGWYRDFDRYEPRRRYGDYRPLPEDPDAYDPTILEFRFGTRRDFAPNPPRYELNPSGRSVTSQPGG